MKVLTKIGNFFHCANKKILFSTLVISAVLPLFIAWGVWTYFPGLFNQIHRSTDFVAGIIALTGYFKRGDFILFNIYIISFISLLIIIPLILNRFAKVQNFQELESKNVSDSAFFLLAFTVFGLVSLILSRSFPLATVFAFLTALYLILRSSTEAVKDIYAKFCSLALFGYFNLIALSVILLTFFQSPELLRFLDTSMSFIFISIMAIAVLCLANSYSKGKLNTETLHKIFLFSQLFLPLLFVAFYQYRYSFQGEVITFFYSRRLMLLCWFVALLMIAINVFRCYVGSKSKIKYAQNAPILLTSLISIAAFIRHGIPTPIMQDDFFHMGELFVPFQQFTQFGSLPYRDLIPMHGMFNYSSGFFNYFFFRGEYSAFAVANNLTAIALTIFVIFTIKRFVSGHYFQVLAAILIPVSGIAANRIFASFIMILALHNRDLRNKPFSFLWWWTILSIFAIAWNPPLGGVTSISFLPLLILSFVAKKGTLLQQIKDEFSCLKNKILWIVLLAIGLAYIPLFTSQLYVLVANMGSNMDGFGTTGLSAMQNAIDIFGERYLNIGFTLLVRPLSFIFAAGLFVVMLFESRESETKQKFINIAVILQVFIFAFLISDYGLSRADNNFGRMNNANFALMIGISFAVGGFLIKNRKKFKYSAWLVPLILGIAIGTGVGNFFNQHRLIFERSAISDDFVMFNGEDAGIANLGTTFATEHQIQTLIDTNFILSNFDSYVDWTNMGANHSVFGKRNPIPLSSFYITMNRSLHYIYLRSMIESMPELILLSPNQIFDSAPVNIRMYPVWRWTMSQGYLPYKHNNILFLLSENSPLRDRYEPANAEFEALMNTGSLRFLPISWASEEIIANRILPVEATLNESGRHGIERGIIQAPDSFVVYDIDHPISGFYADFLKLSLDSDDNLLDVGEFRVSWASDNQVFNEERSLRFRVSNGDMLIPLGSSPRWLLAERLNRIRITFPESMIDMPLPDMSLSLHVYNDTYPIGTPSPATSFRAVNLTDDNWTNGFNNNFPILLAENSQRNRTLLKGAVAVQVGDELENIVNVIEEGVFLHIIFEEGADLGGFAAPVEVMVIK